MTSASTPLVLADLGRDTSPTRKRAGTRRTSVREPTAGDIRGTLLLSRETLGQEFRILRESRGLSQKQIASMAGLAAPMISQIETGKYVPTLDMLQRLFGALDAELVVRLKEDE